MVASTLNDHGAYGRVALETMGDGDQPIDQLRREGVQGLGAIEQDSADPVSDAGYYMFCHSIPAAGQRSGENYYKIIVCKQPTCRLVAIVCMAGAIVAGGNVRRNAAAGAPE
jgi:hypothetical protein